MRYELFYLVGENKTPDLEKIKGEVKNIVENQGGQWLDPEIEEKRKMAYKINGQLRGTYVARRFDISEKKSESQQDNPIKNITKQMKLNQDILRSMIVRAGELPELKSREERRKEARYAEKPAVKKLVTEKPAEKTKEGKKNKTIDEKLEEILNI